MFGDNNMEDLTIYCSVVSYGSYDCAEKQIIYTGISLDEAKAAVENFVFPDPNQNFGCVYVWFNGRNIRTIEMSEVKVWK